MPTLRLDGVDLYYEREGRGPPLLLVAGLFSDVSSWAPVRERLAARHDLIVFDNRCAGRSIPVHCVTNRETMVGDCLRLMDHLELDRVHVLGHSMGAMAGLHLAAGHPGRVASLVAASAAPAATRHQIALFDDMAALYCAGCVPRSQWFRLLFQWLFTPDFFKDDDRLQAAVTAARQYEHVQPETALKAQVEAYGDFGAEPDMAAIACPVLAMIGDQDLLVPPETLDGAFGAIADLDTVLIADAGHSLHWENPAAFVGAVEAFHARLAALPADQAGSVSPSTAVAR